MEGALSCYFNRGLNIEGAHMDMIYIHYVFIEVSVYACCRRLHCTEPSVRLAEKLWLKVLFANLL